MSDPRILDDAEARASLDPGGMGAAVRDLPDQCRDAWEEARRLELPPAYREIERIVILGTFFSQPFCLTPALHRDRLNRRFLPSLFLCLP